MKLPMHEVLVIAKNHDQKALALAADIAAWLEAKEIASQVLQSRDIPENGEYGPFPSHEGKSLAIVLGGDGTMLSVARKLGAKLPLLGVNLGRVGFLTELDQKSWQKGLARILNGGFTISERLALQVSVIEQGEEIFKARVLNDAVVSRGAMARLVNLEISVNRESISLMRADGVAISTPTGATAYCLSAGGPLMHPGLDVVCLAPICPFLNDLRPLILPSGDLLGIRLADSSEAYLTVDGQTLFPLAPGQEIEISGSPERFKLVQPKGASYFKKLREKGFFTQR